MSDGTASVPAEVDVLEGSTKNLPGLLQAWAANLKSVFAEERDRDQEHQQLSDDGVTKTREIQNKLVLDAHSAGHLAILESLKFMSAASWQYLRQTGIAGANELEEQQSGATIGTQTPALANDDLAKITQVVTAAIQQGMSTVIDALANAATGRPPVNQPGTTGADLSK